MHDILLDLFLASGSLAFVLLAALALLALVFLLRLLRGLARLKELAAEEAEALHEDLASARRFARKAGSFITHLLPQPTKRRKRTS